MSINLRNTVICGHFNDDEVWSWASTNFYMTSRSHGLVRSTYRSEAPQTIPPNENVILVKTGPQANINYRLARQLRERQLGVNDLTFIAALKKSRWRTLEDGTLTQLPEQAIEALEIVIDFDELDEGRISVSHAYNESMLDVGPVQSMCIIEGNAHTRLEEAIEALDQRKFRCIKYKGFHKGGAGAEPEFTEQTKKQIFKGSKFILFKHTVHVVNQKTWDWEPVKMLSIGIFCAQSKIDRYSGSRNALADLRADLKSNALRLFNPAEYRRQIRKRTGSLARYYPSIAEQIVTNGNEIPERLWDLLETVDKHPKKPTNRELLALSSRTIANSSDVGKKHQKSKDAFNRIQKQVLDIDRKIQNLRDEKERASWQKRRAENNIKEWTQYIERAQAEIVQYTNALENNDGLIEAQQQQRNIVEPAVNALRLQAERDEAIYKKEMLELIQNPPEGTPNLEERYRNTGFIIKEIRYTNRSDRYDIISLHEDPLLPQNDEYFMSYMCLMTTRPSIIYVNRGTSGENSKKVVGGPYEAEVTVSNPSASPSVRLRLANVHGVFGIRKNSRGTSSMQARIHPHTSNRSLAPNLESLQHFASEWSSVCLGNAAPAISKGFRDQDPRIVIMALLSWITNANGRDEWGKSYTWFPKPNEVDLDGKYGQEPEDETDAELTSESGMKDTLQELANRLAQLTPNEGNP